VIPFNPLGGDVGLRIAADMKEDSTSLTSYARTHEGKTLEEWNFLDTFFKVIILGSGFIGANTAADAFCRKLTGLCWTKWQTRRNAEGSKWKMMNCESFSSSTSMELV